MFDVVGELAKVVAFAALWRQVLLLVGAGVYGAVCWAALRNKSVRPFTRLMVVLGGMLVFCVLAAFVFWKG